MCRNSIQGFYGLSDADHGQIFNTGSLVGPEHATLREILQRLQQTYCSNIGAEYMYIADTKQKRWIQNRLESISAPNQIFPPEYKRHILERLTAAEGLEKYLHNRYVGQKRFSGEGNESLIPLLDRLIATRRHNRRAGNRYGHGASWTPKCAGQYARKNAFGAIPGVRRQASASADLGDVKYHQGFSSRS
jgi:2-oxoglutarate dehydrogenase E1 component